MIPMTLRDVAMLAGGSLHPDTDGVGALVVDGPVVTDSREAAAGSLYVARVGEHADGHGYAGAARDRGAVAALTSRAVDELPCVVVDDVQTAFGRVARGVVDRAPGLTVVAVTGSSGKTSTKDLLAQVLGSAGPTVAPVNSLNGEIGVPLTVCRVDGDTRFLVAEMGARGIGHLAYLTTHRATGRLRRPQRGGRPRGRVRLAESGGAGQGRAGGGPSPGWPGRAQRRRPRGREDAVPARRRGS